MSDAASTPSFDHWFEKTRKTPPEKRSTDPFDQQIFVSDSVGAARVLCDASERARLTDPDARKRWDFFHRPDRALIDALDAEALAEFEAKRKTFSRLNRNGVIAVAAAAAVGGALAWRVSPQIGMIAFLALAILLGLVMLFLFTRSGDAEGALGAIRAFHDEILEEIAEIDADRPESDAMRALHERLIAEAASEYGAAGAEGPTIVLRGWSAARPVAEEPAELRRLAPRWRISARRGGVFALNEHLLVAVEGERVSLRRVLIDLVAGKTVLLEAREMRRPAVELWLRPRHDAVGPLGDPAPLAVAVRDDVSAPEPQPATTPTAQQEPENENPEAASLKNAPLKNAPLKNAPPKNAPPPTESRSAPASDAKPADATPPEPKPHAPKPVAPLTKRPPAPALSRREIALVTSAGPTAIPVADRALFRALAEADRADHASLSREIATLDAPSSKDRGAVADFRRKARRAALAAALADLDADRRDFEAQDPATDAAATNHAATEVEAALTKLRALLFPPAADA